MNFPLFIVLNAVLLIRPEELHPDIEGFRLYMITICLCLCSTYNALTRQITGPALTRQPITVCVFGMLVALILSLVGRGQVTFALEVVPEIVNTPAPTLTTFKAPPPAPS